MQNILSKKNITAMALAGVLAATGVAILPSSADASSSLAGRIVLQVEENGEAWYIDPIDMKRYYLGRPDDAFKLMRDRGLGISNENLNRIPWPEANFDAPADLMRNVEGRIVLQVEQNGESWYVNPVDKKRYFLGSPQHALDLMRSVGLGITNEDLAKIEVGEASELSKEYWRNQSIAAIAGRTSATSTLVTALSAADFVAPFANLAREYTVFAPTNAAFAAVQSTVNTLLEEGNEELLKDVLQYHVVRGKVVAADLEDGMMLTTLNGDKLEVSITDDGVMIGDAKVAQADIMASNGVIHVIDSVLVPEIRTITEIAVATDSLSTLVAGLQAADFVDTFNDASANFTVFAPTNAAFNAAGGINASNIGDVDGLTSVLTYHVVAGSVKAEDLRDGQVLTTLNGETLTVSIEGDTVRVGGATVVAANVDAVNGTVHVIDSVLLP